MTDDEVRELAQRHSEVLENALNILKAFQAAVGKLTGDRDLVDMKRQQQRRADAESAWNRASGAIGDAVRAAGIQAQTTLSGGRAIDTIPSALFHNNVGYPFIQRARGIVESAAGRWEEYVAHPERFPRPEGESTKATEPEVPEPAPLPPIEPSKVPLARILRDMTPGEWIGVVVCLGAIVSATAWIVNWANSRRLDDAKRERDNCAAELVKARAPRLTAAAPSSASSAAP